MRVLVVVTAALISLGTLGILGALAFGLGTIRVVTHTRALPASVRLLTVDTGDVPLVVRLNTDANLDQRVANTDDGAVTLGSCARRVDVNGRSGDISTSTPIAVTESFTAHTESGAISMEFHVAPHTTEAIADGDVTVGLPVPGRYRVRAQTEGRHGETTVTVPGNQRPERAWGDGSLERRQR